MNWLDNGDRFYNRATEIVRFVECFKIGWRPGAFELEISKRRVIDYTVDSRYVRGLVERAFQVILAEVSLNEKRDEIAKLTAEIEHINPDILNLTDQELHDINLKMAEDVKILAEKVSNSPSGGNFGDNGFKEVDISESYEFILYITYVT